jgi:hypothetical protein
MMRLDESLMKVLRNRLETVREVEAAAASEGSSTE